MNDAGGMSGFERAKREDANAAGILPRDPWVGLEVRLQGLAFELFHDEKEPAGLARSRVARRRRRGGDASDATYSVMRELARREAAWPTAADVDTGAPSDALRLEVRELLGVAGCVAAPLSPSGS